MEEVVSFGCGPPPSAYLGGLLKSEDSRLLGAFGDGFLAGWELMD